MQASPRDQSLPPIKRKDEKQTSWEGLHPLTHSYAPRLISLCWSPASDTACGHFNWFNGWCLYCTLYPDYACFSDPILLMPWRLPKHHPKHPAAKMPVLLGRKVIKRYISLPWQTNQWRVSKVKPLSQGRRPLLLAFHLKPQRRCGWCSAGGI